MEREIRVDLSRDEALVLFEALASGALASSAGAGARLVLAHIEAQLERALTEPFRDDYGGLVSDAERRLLGDGG